MNSKFKIQNSRFKVIKALFDIKPVDGAGQVDARKIAAVSPKLNLRLANKDLRNDKFFFGVWNNEGVKDLGVVDYHVVNERIKPKAKLSSVLTKSSPHKEFETILSEPFDVKREIKNIGGRTVVRKKLGKPRYKNSIKYKVLGIKHKEENTKSQESEILNTKYIIHNTKPELEYEAALAQINQKASPAYEPVLTGEPRKIDPFERLLTTSTEFLGQLKHGQETTPRDGRWTSDVKASPEIESWVRYVRGVSSIKYKVLSIASIFSSGLIPGFKNYFFGRDKLLTAGVVGLTALAFILVGQYGIGVKNEILKESNLAVTNLEKANENLRLFDFEAASNNFAEAYEEFSKAGENLNFIGASITSIFAELPGFDKLTAGGAGKLKSAKNLVEAGKLLAESGKSMSEAVSSLSETGAIFNPNYLPAQAGELQIANYEFTNLKRALLSAGGNLSSANALISNVDPDALPEDKREIFAEFKSKLPELEGIVSDAVEYTNFLESFLGFRLATSDGRGTSDVKYLILFQNSSELRPTGGFPGTYAIVTFNNGRLSDILVDDVYNLDGQLKENIIPPQPLQHITPNWGMRDASWFVDFSVSAQKIIQFYEMATQGGYGASPVRGKTSAEGGSSADHAFQAGRTSNGIDGVITMSPRIISDILKVVGPIEMPEYGLTINSENFLSTIQAEVEYGDNRQQPKKVVVDMAPRLLERIYSSDPGRWLDIFNVFVSGMDKKDILMYFKDLGLENFVAKKGFGGLVKNSGDDYLMVTFSNVKGSKTDKVTDNSIKTSVRFEGGRMVHKLQLTRQHNGGLTKYGFYNKQNPAYVRVLVPEGSELISVSGNSDSDYKPLINYSEGEFKKDRDLSKLESDFRIESENGVSIYRESGKTGFAFWLVTDPGQTKTVELQYAVPFEFGKESYDIYVQKQPGLEVDNFEFQVGDAYIYNGEFDKDLELRFKIDN